MLMLPSQISLEELVEYTILMRAHIKYIYIYFFALIISEREGKRLKNAKRNSDAA